MKVNKNNEMIRALAQYFSGGVVPFNPGAIRAMEYGGRYADGGHRNGEDEKAIETSIAPEARKPLENFLFGEREDLIGEEGQTVGKVFKPSKVRQFFGAPDVKATFDHGGKHTGEETAEPPAVWLHKKAMENPGVEVTGSSSSPALRKGLGWTTAVDATATPIRGFVAPGGEEMPAPGRMTPLEPRQPGPLPNPKITVLKRRDGDTPEPTPPSEDMHRVNVGDFFTNQMVFRDYDGSEGRIGQTPHGASGDKRDLFSFGLKTEGGKDKFASREVFQMMQDEGIDPYSPYADEFMRDLHKSNPDLFGEDHETARRMMTEMVQNDPALRQAGKEGFFFPSQGLTPEQKGAILREQNVQGVQALKRNRPKYGQR